MSLKYMLKGTQLASVLFFPLPQISTIISHLTYFNCLLIGNPATQVAPHQSLLRTTPTQAASTTRSRPSPVETPLKAIAGYQDHVHTS